MSRIDWWGELACCVVGIFVLIVAEWFVKHGRRFFRLRQQRADRAIRLRETELMIEAEKLRQVGQARHKVTVTRVGDN